MKPRSPVTGTAIAHGHWLGPSGGSDRRAACAAAWRGRQTTEWKSKALRTYQRRTLAADALIASGYLAGTNTRRVRRALKALFAEGIGKDVVSRVWRKVKSDWEAWNTRALAEEPIVRLILDGTVARVRLDRKATSISLLVAIGVRADGQKVLLAIKSMGGESTEAWRSVLDDLIKRGLQRPQFLIVDGAPGLEKALAAVWEAATSCIRRCSMKRAWPPLCAGTSRASASAGEFPSLLMWQDGRLSREYKTMIFRVITESLTNIHRHSASPRAEFVCAAQIDKSPWKSRTGGAEFHPSAWWS